MRISFLVFVLFYYKDFYDVDVCLRFREKNFFLCVILWMVFLHKVSIKFVGDFLIMFLFMFLKTFDSQVLVSFTYYKSYFTGMHTNKIFQIFNRFSTHFVHCDFDIVDFSLFCFHVSLL